MYYSLKKPVFVILFLRWKPFFNDLGGITDIIMDTRMSAHPSIVLKPSGRSPIKRAPTTKAVTGSRVYSRAAFSGFTYRMAPVWMMTVKTAKKMHKMISGKMEIVISRYPCKRYSAIANPRKAKVLKR